MCSRINDVPAETTATPVDQAEQQSEKESRVQFRSPKTAAPGNPFGSAKDHASALRSPAASSRTIPYLLSLQRHFGNRYVQRLVSSAAKANEEERLKPVTTAPAAIMRDTLDPSWYGKGATSAEENAAKSNMEYSHASLAVIGASNVGDTQAAQAEVAKIKDQEDPFHKALNKTLVLPEVKTAYADNHRAQDTLSVFIAESGVQTTSLNNFKIQYRRLMLDFERLSAMVGLSGISGEQSGQNYGQALVDAQKLTAADKAAAQKDTGNPDAPGADVIATKKADLRKWQEDMTDKASHLGEYELAITSAQHKYLAQCNEVASGLIPKSDPEAVTKLKDLQKHVDEIKGYAKLIVGFAAKSVGGAIGGLATTQIDKLTQDTPSGGVTSTGKISTKGQVQFDKYGMPVEVTTGTMTTSAAKKSRGEEWGAAVGEKTTAKLPDIVGFAASLPFQASLNAATAAANAALETQVAQQKQAQLNLLQGLLEDVQKASKTYIENAAALERAKNGYRKVLMELAQAMDKTGGRSSKKFQTLAAFLGEADAYLAQSKATKDIGRNEMQTAETAKAKRADVTLATGDKECKWWDIKEEKMVASNNMHYVLTKHEVHLPTGAKDLSAGGAGGANEAVEQEMAQLDKYEIWIGNMRDRIKTEFPF